MIDKALRKFLRQLASLPSQSHYEGSKVEACLAHAADGGRRPETWTDFLDLMKMIEVPSNFMAHRQDSPPQERKLC
jgi:hypothetical protein